MGVIWIEGTVTVNGTRADIGSDGRILFLNNEGVTDLFPTKEEA